MTDRTKLEIVGSILALAFAAFWFMTWLDKRDGLGKMQGVIDSQKAVIDGDQKQMLAHQEADRQRDAATDAQIQTMKDVVAKIQTPQQIAKWIPQQLPGLPQPITIQVPAPTPQNPAPDATASIPVADLPALRDTIEKCQENALKLSTCQQDVLSRDEQLRLAGEQLSATEKQRDEAIQTAKGGSVWQRLKRNAHWFAWGGAAVGVAICATGHCK